MKILLSLNPNMNVKDRLKAHVFTQNASAFALSSDSKYPKEILSAFRDVIEVTTLEVIGLMA